MAGADDFSSAPFCFEPLVDPVGPHQGVASASVVHFRDPHSPWQRRVDALQT